MKIKPKYHLVTTALQAELPKDKCSILYLGEWCLPRENNVKIIMPNMWSIGESINNAYVECDKFYRSILQRLVSTLNELHNISYDYKSYELILGNWLKVYIHQIFDKYNNIKYAFENYSIERVSLLDTKNYVTALEYNDYMVKIIDDI